ncbi:hypothetical protein [Micromonospora sp. NPDC005174]|uniref:hypothetical protein n=1 Tax=Micromonospora sp. NPDC005174 TaxID=3157018 RepID=UPI0033A57265
MNDGLRMVAALEAAGFTVYAPRRGAVRMARPGTDEGWWPVPTDPTAPEFAEMLAKVRRVLLEDVAHGEAARTALALYDGEAS